MTQRKLCIVFFFFFAASAGFLFWQNDRELDPDNGVAWWTLSFAAPKQEESLSFIVENHGDQTNFRYEISVGKEIILKDSLIVKRGEKMTITPPSITKQNERVKVIVVTGDDKKEIYR